MLLIFHLNRRTAHTLPLPEEKPDKPRPRIDYIVFVIDLSKEKRLDVTISLNIDN